VSFEIKIFTGYTLTDGCLVALSSRLYVAGWRLATEYRRIIAGGALKSFDERLAIGYLGGVPTTAILETSTLMAFCREPMRRKGYGTLTLKALEDGRRAHLAEEGIEGTRQFWEKNNVGPRWTYW
jgi:hypothetical protein